MPSAYCSSSLLTGLLREELADRPPYVLLAVQVRKADRQLAAFQLGEQLGELRLARPEGGDAAGLDVTDVVGEARDLVERGARRLAVLGGVLAVGRVEEIDVVAARVVALRDHLQGELRDARAHRSAA